MAGTHRTGIVFSNYEEGTFMSMEFMLDENENELIYRLDPCPGNNQYRQISVTFQRTPYDAASDSLCYVCVYNGNTLMLKNRYEAERADKFFATGSLDMTLDTLKELMGEKYPSAKTLEKLYEFENICLFMPKLAQSKGFMDYKEGIAKTLKNPPKKPVVVETTVVKPPEVAESSVMPEKREEQGCFDF